HRVQRRRTQLGRSTRSFDRLGQPEWLCFGHAGIVPSCTRTIFRSLILDFPYAGPVIPVALAVRWVIALTSPQHRRSLSPDIGGSIGQESLRRKVGRAGSAGGD